MTPIFRLLLLLLLASPAVAQQWPVEEALAVVKGVPLAGRRVRLQLDEHRVATAWQKHLAERVGSGKVRESKGLLTISKAEMPAIAPVPLYIVSQVGAGPTGTTVWWRLETDSSQVRREITPGQWLLAEKCLRDFARSLYREDLAVQIAESERTLITTQNNHVALLEKTRQLRLALAQSPAATSEGTSPTASAELLQTREQLAQYEREQEAARNDMAHLRLELEAAKQRLSRLE